MSNRTKRKVANPVNVFASCPCCNSEELIALDVDVICARCDWMSAESYVAAGGMDEFFGAARAHLGLAKSSRTAVEDEESSLDLALKLGLGA